MDTPRYNLIDEAWIPVADRGKASLKEIFASRTCRALVGTPREKTSSPGSVFIIFWHEITLQI